MLWFSMYMCESREIFKNSKNKSEFQIGNCLQNFAPLVCLQCGVESQDVDEIYFLLSEYKSRNSCLNFPKFTFYAQKVSYNL